MSKPTDTAAKPGAPTGKTEGADHKPTAGKSSLRERTYLPGVCHAVGCKAHASRYDFCDEHYDHFKFGLIKRSGDLVSDYEKKFEHYKAYKARQGARKVA